MKGFVIAGIGTGVGKTIVSASLTEALRADYWKPIQAGELENSDTLTVKNLVTNTISHFHSEAYRLNSSLSPHAAAEIDGLEIEREKLKLPETENSLLIELAGGLMAPLNQNLLNIDLVVEWDLPVILVSQNYLGSINHTLLSIELLKNRKVPIEGMIFNGDNTPASETIILSYSGCKLLGRVPKLGSINQQSIKEVSKLFKEQFLIHDISRA